MRPYDLPDDHKVVTGAREYPGHSGSNYYSLSKTIKAGGHGVPGGENMIRFPDGTLRYMTVHEAKLIQTFPEDYIISGSWGEAMRQIGNAVPVVLAEKIGRSVLSALQGKKSVTTVYRFHRSRPEQLRLALEPQKRKATKSVTKTKKPAKKPTKSKKPVKSRYKRKPADG